MAKPIIAIDIDEVLSPLHDLFFAHHNEVYGTNYPIRDPAGGYYLHEYTDEPKSQILEKIKKFIETEAFRNVEPLEDAVEVLSRLKKRFKLVIITSRQDFYHEVTHAWLGQHFPSVFDEIQFTEYIQGEGSVIPKSEICQQLGAQFMVEDNLETASKCAEAGITTLLFGDYPWNRVEVMPKNMVRTNSWLAIEEYFDGIA